MSRSRWSGSLLLLPLLSLAFLAPRAISSLQDSVPERFAPGDAVEVLGSARRALVVSREGEAVRVRWLDGGLESDVPCGDLEEVSGKFQVGQRVEALTERGPERGEVLEKHEDATLTLQLPKPRGVKPRRAAS